MERRKFIKNVAGTAVAGGILTGPIAKTMASKKEKSKKEKEVIAHYVLFWLKDDLTEQEVNDFTGFFEELKAIPNIKSLHYGPPAKTHQRDVVDNSFSYNLLVYFDTMEDIDTYENHPIHLAAIDKYSKNWAKVVVHDSVIKV